MGNDLVFDTDSFYWPKQPGSYPIVLATYEVVCSKYPRLTGWHGCEGVPAEHHRRRPKVTWGYNAIHPFRTSSNRGCRLRSTRRSILRLTGHRAAHKAGASGGRHVPAAKCGERLPAFRPAGCRGSTIVIAILLTRAIFCWSAAPNVAAANHAMPISSISTHPTRRTMSSWRRCPGTCLWSRR